MLLIDIGGQDTKIIRIENGMVTDFLMNDKCSAGTGRFLEVMANTLSLTPQDLCELASKGSGTSISSMCTVFAESEVISLIGRGESRENIAFAVIDSIVQKVVSQAARLTNGQEECICLTGGLCDYSYLKKSLGESLKTDVLTDTDGRYAGAIGAALSPPLSELQSMRIPVLSLETDYADTDAEQLRTRIGAFIEMLND